MEQACVPSVEQQRSQQKKDAEGQDARWEGGEANGDIREISSDREESKCGQEEQGSNE